MHQASTSACKLRMMRKQLAGPPINHTESVQVLGYLAGGPWLPGQAAPAAQLREQRFINVVKHASTHTPGHAARLE